MKKIFYLFLLLLVAGCEKEADVFFTYPATLVAREYKIVSQVQVFTNQGPITDASVISNYLKKDTTGFFYPVKDAYVPLKYQDTIVYQSKDTVLFNLPGDWGKRIVKRKGAYLYLYLPDTLIGYNSQMQDFKNVVNNLGVQKPYRQEVAVSSPYGSPYVEVYDALIAKGDPNELEFPRINYLITRKRKSSSSGLRVSNYNNVFDPKVIKWLEAGDTLAIQEGKTIYKKLNP